MRVWDDRLVAEDGIGESRWPPVVAVLVFMALNIALRIWLPSAAAVRVPFLVPAIEAILVVALITSHPGARTDRRRMRRFALWRPWHSHCSAWWWHAP
jgi:hypothetical protein